MDPLILLIEPELDERAATATMSRAQRVYEEGARDISRIMREQLTEGTEAAGRGFDDLETKARRAYLSMQDAADKVAREQAKLDAAVERGSANTEAIARRVERARLAEIDAIEKATTAYREYENAAQNAGRAGEEAGESAASGFRSALGAAAGAGQEFADGFTGGFAGAGVAARLAGLAIPGVGWLAAGVTAGTLLGRGISQGLESMQMKDLFQARLGIDDATMAEYGAAAGSAYAGMWGASVEDNLRAVQFGVQAGMIAPDASDDEIERSIVQLQTLATVMEVDVQEAARSAGQLMRGGFAADGEQAADIIATGFRNGLDISGDWLDTINEYSTQFRKLGLDGQDAIGLITQGLQGGARDSDKVADSLKEFSIRAVDGSKLTAEGFAALGFQADDMAQRFLAGGDSARQAFGVTIEAIKSMDDPVEQALVWTALFGTQWEDMGDAINRMDLSKARTEFSDTEGAIDRMTTQLSEHTNGWTGVGREIDVTFGKLKEWLADSAIGRFLSQGVPAELSGSLKDLQRDWFGVDNNYVGAPGVPVFPQGPGIGTPSVPTVASGNPLDIFAGGLTGPDVSAADIYKQWYQPAPPEGAPGAPVPSDRDPMLTETQKEAQKEAEGGGSKESLPPAPVLPLEYSNTAGLPSSLAGAVTRLDEANHSVAEKEARLNQLRQSNVATAEDIQKAENDLVKAQQSQLKAQQSLTEAQGKAYETQNKQLDKLSNDIGEFGAQIDDDFGVSNGLAGIAENITKFVANLAFAPAYGALSAVREANGFGQGEAGSGLFGALAGSGAFGDQYMAVPRWARDRQEAASSAGYGDGYSAAASMPYSPGSPQPGESARAFAHRVMKPYFEAQGLEVGDHAADQYGEHQNGALDIMVPNIAAGNAVLQQVLSDPNTYGAIFNNQAYGYGQGSTPRPYTGPNPHTDHVHAWYKPGGENNIMPSAGAPRTSAATAPSAAPVPTAGPSTPGVPSAPPGSIAAAAQAASGAGTPIGPSGLPAPGTVPTGGPLGTGFPNAFGAGQAAPSQSVRGGRAWGQGQPESGGIGFGGSGVLGMLGSAVSGAAGAAGSAAGMGMDGGAGGQVAAAVADMGIQQLQRAAGAAGQYVGALVGGLGETFMLNGSALGDPSSSWFGRIAGAAAGVRVALPNSAGMLGGAENPNMAEGGKEQPPTDQPPGPLTPEQAAAQQQAQGGQGGNVDNSQTNNVTINNPQTRDLDGANRDVQTSLGNIQGARQPR